MRVFAVVQFEISSIQLACYIQHTFHIFIGTIYCIVRWLVTFREKIKKKENEMQVRNCEVERFYPFDSII